MKRFDDILLKAWPIVSQNHDLANVLIGVDSIISSYFPVQVIFIRRLSTETQKIETLATSGNSGSNFNIVSCNTDCFQALKDLYTEKMTIDFETIHRKTAKALRPEQNNQQCLVTPIKTTTKDLYFFLIILPEFTMTKSFYYKLINILRQPIAVAIKNSLSYDEMLRLKEAVDADKKRLLTKLGRDKVTDKIIGSSSGLQTVTERVNIIAGSDLPVLIFGETGTGKELISHSIHNKSSRCDGPFIRVNCGAIPPELIDSHLFGHEKGAFTGAVETRVGWFERANSGTLFLDEIGDLPLDAQVRFLRILQDGWLERVGGKHPVKVNVRIVMATNSDLVTLVSRGKFREDLWYRISTFPIFLPPLRERLDDLEALANHFTQQSAVRFGLSTILPTKKDIAMLANYNWPGNIRELKAVIDRAVLLGNGKTLKIAKALGWQNSFEEPPVSSSLTEKSFCPLDKAMKNHIERALKLAKGKVEGASGAAQLLKINPHTLRGRMRKLGINWNEFKEN